MSTGNEEWAAGGIDVRTPEEAESNSSNSDRGENTREPVSELAPFRSTVFTALRLLCSLAKHGIPLFSLHFTQNPGWHLIGSAIWNF